ncbi:MAG: hypothetical protein Q4B58_00045 [Bacteroidales bacterium]|nr:hypothetical protein [Bacteroidales bacterium]
MKHFFVAAATVLMLLSSCNTKKTDKPVIEVEKLEEEVACQVDSLAGLLCEITEKKEIKKLFHNPDHFLTDAEKLVKPDYLLSADDIKDLVSLSQKYRAWGMMIVDSRVRNLYDVNELGDMNRIFETMKNDLFIKNIQELKQEDNATALSVKTFQDFYDLMKENNRMDYFYEATTSMGIEVLYVVSNNPNLYMKHIDDETAAAISRHFELSVEGLKALRSQSSSAAAMFKIIDPLIGLKASNAEEMKKALVQAKINIALARQQALESPTDIE